MIVRHLESSRCVCAGCRTIVDDAPMLRAQFTDFHGTTHIVIQGFCFRCEPSGTNRRFRTEARVLRYVLLESRTLPRPGDADELQIRARLAELESLGS